jgi:hypothetical protein
MLETNGTVGSCSSCVLIVFEYETTSNSQLKDSANLWQTVLISSTARKDTIPLSPRSLRSS